MRDKRKDLGHGCKAYWGKVVYNKSLKSQLIDCGNLIFTQYMNRFNTIDFIHNDSKLFSHYSKFFDDFVVEEFRRKSKADTSFKGHKALMLEIEAYVSENIKIESKEDYANLVDTLKNLAENDL